MKKTLNSLIRKLRVLMTLSLLTLVFYAFAKPEYIELSSVSQTENVNPAAKKGKVYGKVSNIEGKYLEEATVVIKGTTIGTVTDVFGNFILKNVSKDAELVFSYVGFKTVEIKPDLDQPMNVKMEIITIGIQKIVVSPEPETTTLSVSSDEFGVTIKGIIDNNPPLFVLDGREIGRSEFNKFGADNIEHISLLKDSSEIDKYGEKGENGVILITSKKIVLIPAIKKMNDIQVVGAEDRKEKKSPFTIVEEMPQFPGGEKRMMYYLSVYTKYPVQAKTDKIEGTVEVNFMVSSRGKVEKVKVLKSVHTTLDTEAVRIISSMPYWNPGKQNGKPVEVYYTIPIEFSLQSKDNR